MATSMNYVPANETDFSGPSWNNSNEYPSLNSNEFAYDQEQLQSLITRIEATMKPLFINGVPAVDEATLVTNLQAVCEMEEQAYILAQNMQTYAGCLITVDGSNTEANAAYVQLQAMSGKIEAITKPVSVYLMSAPEELLQKYFAHAHVKPYEFLTRYRRQIADTNLSEAEESLIARLKANGPLAFGALYDQLSSQIRCDYQGRQIGLAEAAGLLRSGDETKRRNAWQAIQAGWQTQETSAAAILNSLAGWRLELNEQRTRRRGKKVHFLDLPLHDSRIKRETLDAMMTAVKEKQSVGQRAMKAMAREHGKETMDPWDLLAPAPSNKDERLTFEKGIGLIREAFEAVDPSLSDFVDTMKKNRWIEGRQLPNKRPGAYCTRYPKSSSPRVFQTYMGSLDDVRTLAHELGHAYHGWVMRDLARPLTFYPMTLAETASIFAETAFADSIYQKALKQDNMHSAREIAWQNTSGAAAHLLNIPARFTFEQNFYERRQKGIVSPTELSDMMDAAWTQWYGSTLTANEKQYWMTKLHFSIPTVSFYNYPYTFGALFSLGIYALRKERGVDFWPSYNALLRDTGRMTAEDLAQKHMGEDLTKPEFWLKSIAIVDHHVKELEDLTARPATPVR